MKAVLLLASLFIASVVSDEWKNIKDALEEAKATDKLVLYLITRSSCKPCKKLSNGLQESSDFKQLKEKFVLAKSEDEKNLDSKYDVDGKYVPKILFVSSSGVVLQTITNADAKSKKAKYFYKKAEHVVKSMQEALKGGNLDNGFGKDYAWHDWESGLQTAREQSKPIIVVFHQDWCGACQRLKPKFAASTEIKELAHHFIMINTDAEEIVKGDKYKADGEYYPKILFLDEFGELIEDELNYGTKHKHVLHYYDNGAELAESMKRVIANISIREKIEDRGFGKHINWVKYEEGKVLAREQNKPMMVIIHKSYCGACKAMKPKIRNDKEIAKLSKLFIMVNCEDDEEPLEDQFDQDGAYIPRIFFLDNLGNVETTLYNTDKDYEQAKFAYATAKSIAEQMKVALDMKIGERTPPPQQQAEIPDSHELGFGTNITWYNYADGAKEAKKSHMAAMLVFYNDYCEFSKYMKHQFRTSKEITEKSKRFVMIKVDEEEGKDLGERFAIDGPYTPRIVFMDPDQNVRSDINNTGTPYNSTMFYYGKPEDILAGMDMALAKINLTLGRGFGEYIYWVKYEKALEIAKEQGMPIMLIVHRSWCMACKGLKPIIAESRPIWKLSFYFIMVNVEDEEEPLDNQYFVDGGYYPRIFFMNHEGKVVRELHNRDPSYLRYKYSYGTEEQILSTMKFAIAKLSPYAEHYRFNEYKEQHGDNGSTQQTSSTTEQSTATTTATSATATSATTTTTTETTKQTSAPKGQSGKLTPGKTILADSGNKFVTLQEALVGAKKVNKPILFIIHRTTCPACKAVLRMISRDPDFKTKAEPFILADVEDDIDERTADSYDLDGGYVPRIYFLDPEGKVLKEFWNVGTNYLENKYYYYEMQSLYRSMEKVLEYMANLKTSGESKKEEPKKDEKTAESASNAKEEKNKEEL